MPTPLPALHPDTLRIQWPAAEVRQLLLLLHGVGADARSMAALGQRLAAAFPQAAVLSLAAPADCDLGQGGRQWFSVQGITEANRPGRVAAAMPAFQAVVQACQQATGVGPQATALIGFSQGAIMALESTQCGPALAARVVALAGRFATAEPQAPAACTLHFVHGKADAVIPYGHTVVAAERLVRLGADLTADVLPFLGHQLTEEVATLVLERLQGYLPRRVWEAALRDAPGLAPTAGGD